MTSTADLMLQFYGIDKDGEEVKPPDPMDIDGNAFEAEPYFRQLVQKENLKTLVQKDKIIKSEISTLDTDLQSLVYDNYTKFLLAEETIRSMSDGLSSLSAKMQNVLDSLQSVSKSSTEIQNDLNPNREKIQRLVGINRLLERIDFISQLPTKLRAHVDIKEYESAVDTWLKAEKVLETQTHFESFVRIRDECKSILEDIKVKVKAVMTNPETTPKQAVVSASTLLKLQLPVDDTILELVKFRLHLELEKLNDSEKIPKDSFEILEYMNENIAPSVMEFITTYQSLLQKYVPLKKNSEQDKYIASFRKELYKKITDSISEDDLYKMNCETFASFLMKFTDGIGKIFTQNQMESYTQSILQKYIKQRFAEILGQVITEVTKADVTSEVDQAFTDIISNFKRSVNLLMGEFDTLTRINPEAKDIIISETSKMFSSMEEEFNKIDARYSLLTFGIQHQFSEQTIPLVYELVSRFDPKSPLLKMKDMLCTEVGKSASKSLQKFVDLKRAQLSELIAQGMTTTNWLEARTPHDVSITSNLVIQDFILIWGQLDKILGKVRDGSVASSHSSAFSSRNTLSHFSTHSGPSNQMPLFHGLRDDSVIQIDRLFTNLNHLHLSSVPEFNSKSVLTSIAMYVLKTLLEFIRMNTFSCAGFNQMQVDAYFIYMTICDKIDQQSLFNAMIEELMSSAADRTINPIPFKMVVLSEIYTRSESKPVQKESI